MAYTSNPSNKCCPGLYSNHDFAPKNLDSSTQTHIWYVENFLNNHIFCIFDRFYRQASLLDKAYPSVLLMVILSLSTKDFSVSFDEERLDSPPLRSNRSLLDEQIWCLSDVRMLREHSVSTWLEWKRSDICKERSKHPRLPTQKLPE